MQLHVHKSVRVTLITRCVKVTFCKIFQKSFIMAIKFLLFHKNFHYLRTDERNCSIIAHSVSYLNVKMCPVAYCDTTK